MGIDLLRRALCSTNIERPLVCSSRVSVRHAERPRSGDARRSGAGATKPHTEGADPAHRGIRPPVAEAEYLKPG